MAHPIALDPPEFGPTETPIPGPRSADVLRAQRAAFTERSAQPTQFGPGAGATAEAQDLLLIQMHYDEYLARLFENGQLGLLGG